MVNSKKLVIQIYETIFRNRDIASIINQYAGASAYKKTFDIILKTITNLEIQDRCYETTYTINQNFFSTKIGNVNSNRGFQIIELRNGEYETILDYNKKYIDCIIYSDY